MLLRRLCLTKILEPRLKFFSDPIIQHQQSTEPLDFSFNPEYEPEFKFFDGSLLAAVKRGDQEVHDFFRLLALCHTVMPEQKNGRLEYQVSILLPILQVVEFLCRTSLGNHPSYCLPHNCKAVFQIRE